MRLKAMTATAIPTGLFPIMFGRGASSGVMRSTGALMIGGMIAAPVRSMQMIPAFCRVLERRRPHTVRGRALTAIAMVITLQRVIK